MNGKRAKRLRKLVAGFDLSDTPKYSDIKSMRQKRKYAADGTYELVDNYPVRTLFLVKCKRAAYRRLKRKDRSFQDQMLTLVQSV